MSLFKQVYGFGEIKRIDGQILKAFDVISDILNPLIQQKKGESNMYEKLLRYQDKVLELGFKPQHSTGATFLGKKQVIKFGYNIIPCAIPKKSHRLPTMIYHFDPDRWFNYNYRLMIQPRVQTFDPNDEYPKFIQSHDYSDCHYENLCYYGGRVVLLDW